MIKNYIKLFLRSLQRQKLFSTINILGLTISLTSTIFIYLYVSHEFNYDRFHYDVEKIYRVNQTFIWGEDSNAQFSSTGPGVAYAIQKEIPEIEMQTSIHTPGEFITSYINSKGEPKNFQEENVLAADSNFLRMFNFPIVKGNEKTALLEKNSIVLTASTAKRYFGDRDPLGELIEFKGASGANIYKVTGVVQDPPGNSYINFNMLLSLNSFPIKEELAWSWIWTQLETYIKLNERADLTIVRDKVSKIPSLYLDETLKRMGTSYEDYIKSGKEWELFLQPMTSIHLPNVPTLNRLNDVGNRQMVFSMIGAGIFILVLSTLNFMNLSTAQFTKRVKEASVRKVLGQSKLGLGKGYFIEALFFTSISFIVAVGLVQVILPLLNPLSGMSLKLNLLGDPFLITGAIVLVIIISLLSSSYPAYFLNSFNPISGLKGKIRGGTKDNNFRKGLVVFQFSLSIILIICTAIVFQQLSFLVNKDLGFDRESLLVIKDIEKTEKGRAILDDLQTMSDIGSASLTTAVPPSIWGADKFVGPDRKLHLMVNHLSADEEFINTLNLNLVEGRGFIKENPYDKYKIIVNEKMVGKLGFSSNEEALGKKIYRSAESEYGAEIIGVVADFNYWQLSNPIEPLAIYHFDYEYHNTNKSQFIVAKVNDKADGSQLLATIEKKWNNYENTVPFTYHFVDQAYEHTVSSEKNLGLLLSIMSALAIIIGTLGLLGMVIFALERRTKEIGIRKVSGASSSNIISLISGEYSKLILIAFVIGSIAAYYIITSWLESFIYRIEISPITFIATGFGLLIITISITGYHSLKSSRMNPAEVLKDE